MIEGHLYFFPLSVCILIPCAYFTSFFVAVHFGHLKFEFPFLNHSSTDSPESCIYSQIINFVSFLLIITIYIRYRQITELIRNNPTCGIRYIRFNITFLICGIIAAFSLSITSNFPHTNVYSIRIMALYTTYLTSVGALNCETLLSLWIQPLLYSSRILPILRSIITIICTLTLFLFLIVQTIILIKYDNENKPWTSTTLGWNYHLTSIISTWILTSFLLLYLSTLIIDFHRIKIISPKIFLTNDITDEQNALSLSI
ncbi:hypothetical protein I4U23_024272 [Adineta vaga]|nr:hypothetical protein I4U23_024272 [Adineta vaga]